MRKFMYIEIAVLLVLLIVSVVVCSNIAGKRDIPTEPPQTEAASTVNTTEETTEPTTEPTTEAPTEIVISWMTVPSERQLLAQQYFVYDVNAEEFVVTSAVPEERVYPASITKLLTAYVVLQHVDLDRSITAGDAMDMVSWDSSVAGLQKGDTLTAEKLIEAMLLPSGNDAAYVLAAEVGRIIDDNMEENAVAAIMTFMKEMNRQAQALGMTGSHFVNPDGMHDENHYMTFADLRLLGKLSLENETIRKYAGVTRETVNLTIGEIEWKNTNKLIQVGSDYYCPYAIGLKTGKTQAAGNCLLSAFEVEDRQWIIGVFGCPGEDDRFVDTIQLFNETVQLFNENIGIQ